jgi:hypothetical protein
MRISRTLVGILILIIMGCSVDDDQELAYPEIRIFFAPSAPFNNVTKVTVTVFTGYGGTKTTSEMDMDADARRATGTVAVPIGRQVEIIVEAYEGERIVYRGSEMVNVRIRGDMKTLNIRLDPVVPTEVGDSISIKSVFPSSGLVDGAETNFTVVIEYTLVTKDSGEVMVGFNNGDSVSTYTMISDATAIIDEGSGEHTFNVTVRVKDWGGRGDFKVYVNLSEHPHPFSWSPLASDTQALSF